MWRQYWHLAFDPFPGTKGNYVRLPGHDEALARLLDIVENGQRLGVLQGEGGLGKTVVFQRLVDEARSPSRRFARVTSPLDATALFAGLAGGLGRPAPRAATRTTAWRSLQEAVQLCSWQKQQPILLVDDLDAEFTRRERADIERLTALDPSGSCRLTVLIASRRPGSLRSLRKLWLLDIRLSPLTRSETQHYLAEKLAVAGRTELVFTSRAVHAVYQLSRGVPRSIDRLASLALMAGAFRKLEAVGPDVVQDVSEECLRPYPGSAA